ncbi:MAG: prepilin-type N-terminal cleavage/methylation domain-containing protein [Synergistaceae bacterium]|nr:prepilin-type N-terminal cleavage/methylation domain-containing protein [Synergistaceae bacterium]
MRKLKAETLVEFITAMAIFSILMLGVFNFMANQTSNTARLLDRDFFVFHAQKYLNGDTSTQSERGTLTFSRQGDNLIISDGSNSMTFQINFDLQ